MRVLVLASFGLLLSGCGHPAVPCPVPTGCVRVEQANGACACAEWQAVSSEAVSLPFVLIGVFYAPVGNASAFRYGVTWDPSQVPESASTSGTTVRAVIRRSDGGEQIARVGTFAERLPLTRASETEVRVFQSAGLWTLTTDVDFPSTGNDWISVWTNAVATVVTDYVGAKTVGWSAGPDCFDPAMACAAGEPMGLTPRLIRGEVSWTPFHDAFLASLTPEERTALLAFDPRAAGGAVEWPRHEAVASDVPLGPTVIERPVAWQPCTGGFEVLAETAIPLAGGDTFVLQYGVQSDGTCTVQRPGVLVGSTSPGCAVTEALYVDRLTGTLVAQPGQIPPECTTGP